MTLDPVKQAAIMSAIESAELKIEHNNMRILEIQSNSNTLISSIKLLRNELAKASGSNGFGDSMNFAKDGLSIGLGCGHLNVHNGICQQCKERV